MKHISLIYSFKEYIMTESITWKESYTYAFYSD